MKEVNSELIDNPESKETESSALKAGLIWWEKKRLWFNVFVGLSGIIPILFYVNHFMPSHLIGVFFYGLILNICYSLGFGLEPIDN